MFHRVAPAQRCSHSSSHSGGSVTSLFTPPTKFIFLIFQLGGRPIPVIVTRNLRAVLKCLSRSDILGYPGSPLPHIVDDPLRDQAIVYNRGERSGGQGSLYPYVALGLSRDIFGTSAALAAAVWRGVAGSHRVTSIPLRSESLPST